MPSLSTVCIFTEKRGRGYHFLCTFFISIIHKWLASSRISTGTEPKRCAINMGDMLYFLERKNHFCKVSFASDSHFFELKLIQVSSRRVTHGIGVHLKSVSNCSILVRKRFFLLHCTVISTFDMILEKENARNTQYIVFQCHCSQCIMILRLFISIRIDIVNTH